MIVTPNLRKLTLTAPTLSVYKPAGVTPYGRRKSGAGKAGERTPRWVRLVAIGVLVLLLVLAMLLAGRGDHGPGRHSGAPLEATG